MKIFLIILTSIAAFLALILLLLCLLVKVRVIYDGEVTVKVGALCVYKTLVPSKPKLLNPGKEEKKKEKRLKAKKKKEKALKKKEKNKKKSEKKGAPQKKKASVGELFGFYSDLTKEVFLPALQRFGKKLHVKIVKMKIEIASGDAGTTAVMYGAAVSGGTALLEALRHAVKLKMGREKDIYIVTRFDKTEFSAEAEMQIALRPLPTVIKLAPLFFKYLTKKEEFEKQLERAGKQPPDKNYRGHKYPKNQADQ